MEAIALTIKTYVSQFIGCSYTKMWWLIENKHVSFAARDVPNHLCKSKTEWLLQACFHTL